jgi:hypothetical protein
MPDANYLELWQNLAQRKEYFNQTARWHGRSVEVEMWGSEGREAYRRDI